MAYPSGTAIARIGIFDIGAYDPLTGTLINENTSVETSGVSQMAKSPDEQTIYVYSGGGVITEFDVNFTTFTTHSITGVGEVFTTDDGGFLYFLIGPSLSLKKYSSTFSFIQSWTPFGSASTIITLDVNSDGSKLYFTDTDNPNVVKAWDLVNDVALPNLIILSTDAIIVRTIHRSPIDSNIYILANFLGSSAQGGVLYKCSSSGTILSSITVLSNTVSATITDFALQKDGTTFWTLSSGSAIPLDQRTKHWTISGSLITSVAPQPDIPGSRGIVVIGFGVEVLNDCSGGALPGSTGSGNPSNDPGCVNCIPGGALPPELPSFFSGLLIGAGATTCWDIGIINAILGGMQSNGFYPQVNSSGQARGRFYKDSPTNYDLYVDTNHGCQWAWIAHGF